jgi:protein-tyrosine phosphatase
MNKSGRTVKMSEPFVDLHCHLLPGLDDGAATLEEALAMAEMAVADGIGTVVATPHQLGHHAKTSSGTIREAVVRFQQALDQRKLPLRVLPGADVRIEPDLVRKIRTGQVLTLADRCKHLLLELPHEVYVPLDGLLAELASAGIVGILSHPERNQGILRQPGVLRPLVERGCLMQVTAGSLTGSFGSQIQGFSKSLIEQGLVHFISTDAHGPKSRVPVLSRAFEQVAEIAGEKIAVDLCRKNPRAVVAGESVSAQGRKTTKHRWTGWFRNTFASEPMEHQPI